MEYVALDLETTGLDPERDRVIEVGAVAFTTDTVLATLDRLVDPGRSVPDAVIQLTGIRSEDLRGAAAPELALRELADFVRGRQPVGHGATLDTEFLGSAGLWDQAQEIIDTLHVARILLPDAPSHSLPLLAADLGLEQPRPHRALDDADATRQLFLRLREEAAAMDEGLKEAMLALVAPYQWAIARFFAESLTAAAPVENLRSTPPPYPPHKWGGVTRRPVADDPAALAELIGPGGELARAFPDYEHRESQMQMLLAVAQIFQRGGMLAVEAGTGTGKSLAYLIPALARATRRKERVVVSTNTHTLQEQLMQKDLPWLREWLPWDFRACLLKGRSNYVSLRRWRGYLAEPCHDAEELRFKLKVLVWLQRTETGDRSELRLQGREEVLWARIASDPLDCVGVHCTAEDCYVHRARAEAEEADLVVVNHALLLADAAQGGGVLPEYQHLVIDEAHHLEDAATQGLRCEIDGPGLIALLERLASEATSGQVSGLIPQVAAQPNLGAADSALEDAIPEALRARSRAQSVFGAATAFVRDRLAEEDLEHREENLRLVPDLRQTEAWVELQGPAADLSTAMAALDAHLRRAVAAGRAFFGDEEPESSDEPRALGVSQPLRELEIIRGRIAEAGRLLQEAFLEPDPNRVYWLTLVQRTENLLVRSAPLSVGSLLRDHVYRDRSTVVFTSASLAVGGSFDFFLHRVGVEREVETLLLASPFDYLEQALVCLPAGIPDPMSEEFDAVLVEVIADIARRIGGRTLVLFTSHRQLRDVYFMLKQRADLDQVLILGQGVDGQRRQVLRSFEDSDRALLLGTSSFWEGIDIPGDRLSCVVMVKLPFPVPSDPVFAARAEQVRDPFTHYALPIAALRLKQGFGRLIRRSTDRGAVVILDNRILGRDYGKAFLAVLPPASTYRGPLEEVGERVEEWLSAGSLQAR
jgi:predicted DnaQ family exonuclease/DinG family helicase